MPAFITGPANRMPTPMSHPQPTVRWWHRLHAFDVGLQCALRYFWRHVAAAFFALLFGLLTYEAVEYKDRLAKLTFGASQATGTVVSVNLAKDGTWTVGYTFTDTDGRQRRGLQGSLPGKSWATGASVVVRYSPRDSTINAISVGQLENHAKANMRLAWVAICIALVAALFQAHRLMRSWRSMTEGVR